MKRIITVLLFLSSNSIYAQSSCDDIYYNIDFEDTICLYHINIDTSSFPDNIWQIGYPQKPLFDSTANPTKVIITDTINPYPINNHSVFTIRNFATSGDLYGFKMFQGAYNVQTDPLNDYGLMEFSPDNGTTWVDLFNDTIYNVSMWYSQVPVLTGNSNGWRYFDLSMVDLGSVFNLNLGDTLLYRFTFISDSIADTLGGLMFDNFSFSDFVEGVSEIHFKPIKSKIYPNPVNKVFTIEFENPTSDAFDLSIYDIHSNLKVKKNDFTGSRITLDAESLPIGMYVYKLTNPKAKKRSWGKFIKSE